VSRLFTTVGKLFY